MTDSTIAATPVSRAQLREVAAWMRKSMGLEHEMYMPVEKIIEYAPLWFENYNLTIEIKEIWEFEPDEHGYFDPGRMRIALREDIYEGACNGNGRDRMTIMHELCHFILIILFGIKLSRRFGEIKPYESPEWQAKCLAGEFMMPASKIIDLEVDEIVEKCGVSYDAATKQLNALK